MGANIFSLTAVRLPEKSLGVPILGSLCYHTHMHELKRGRFIEALSVPFIPSYIQAAGLAHISLYSGSISR